MGPRAGLDAVAKKKILTLLVIELRPSKPIARPYVDCAIPTRDTEAMFPLIINCLRL
jgi:hypothetical protein